MRWYRFLLLSSLLGLAIGCGSVAQGISAINPFERKFVTADPTNPAIEVACIWQPSEGPNAQGVPVRGFAGQMFFFTKKNSEPVLVNGDVRVYLFADRGTPEERGKPMHQYDFTPEAWSSHATLTSLGPGYSIFIPYPGSEAYQVRCQLRTRFTPKEGPPIWSEAMTMILEGPPRPGQEPNSWTQSEESPASSAKTTLAISNQKGTLTQLNSGQSENQSADRKLRTHTFPLGGIQQISHEQMEQSPQIESPAILPPEIEEKLQNLTQQERQSPSGHPLAAASNTTRQQESHPLNAMRPAPLASPVGPTRNLHPLNQTDRLLEPLPPLGSEPNRYRYKMFPPRESERAQGNTLNTPRPYSVPLASEASSPTNIKTTTGSRASFNEPNTSGDYGVWQPMTE